MNSSLGDWPNRGFLSWAMVLFGRFLCACSLTVLLTACMSQAAPKSEYQGVRPRMDNPAPAYPIEAQRAHETGVVLLSVDVDIQGMPIQVEIQKSSGFSRLDNAAMDVVKQWRFIPATLGNQPMAAKVTVPVRFKLDE